MTRRARRRSSQPKVPSGGMPARRAMFRWAARQFRSEWRQQILVLALIIVAVAAVFVGAAVSANTPLPKDTGFGTAHDLATFGGSKPATSTKFAQQLQELRHRFGAVEVIENEQLTVPGSTNTYDLRAQSSHGPFSGPMLALVSGHYPQNASQVAVTSGVESEFDLHVGSTWTVGGASRRVVGVVENPQSLLDEFALVVPGQVSAPTQVEVLFDAPGVQPASIGPNVTTPDSVASSNTFNPETITLAVTVIGMLLIALVSIGGFTVLAHRRLRSIGMVEATGATDKHVRLVVQANGLVVGVVGTVLGFVLGLLLWLAYRPSLEQSSHHLFSVFALPWLVIGPGMGLAVLAAWFAASRPARAITKVPIVAALAGRPAPPKQVHRSAIPGLVLLVLSFVLLGFSTTGSSAQPDTPFLVTGLLLLIPAMILLSPFCLSIIAKLARWSPVPVRLALRDLNRYRARASSALGAISIGLLIAVVVLLVSASRYGNMLDYAGQNLAPDQMVVYTPSPAQPTFLTGPPPAPTATEVAQWSAAADRIAGSVGAGGTLELLTTSATLDHLGTGRNWSGPIYVATPQLLHAFGINPSSIDPNADILTWRPGISSLSNMQLTFAAPKGGPSPNSATANSNSCTPQNGCLDNPVIQEVSALPSGTSAPNTVITEHAINTLHLASSEMPVGWFIQTRSPLTAAQIHTARQAADLTSMTIETKSDSPTAATVFNWATIFGVGLALAILAMTIGLIRSEAAGDLRTLAATGASGYTRRAITASTAAALALIGAVLGVVGAYVGVLGWIRNNSFEGGVGAVFNNVPVGNLLVILLAMPAAAAVIGWLVSGRQPVAMSHQPIE